MDFHFAPDQEAFREEVRAFIEDHASPAESRRSGAGYALRAHERTLEFQKGMAERKWLTLAWPQEYGGLEASHWQQMVLNEEMAYQRAPSAQNMGTMWVGPALMLVGTPEQRTEHLKNIATAADDSWWCTLYSEPGAGSDLASLQTRAVAEGDEYVLNGQKIWTSGAHFADWGWLAARTDPDAPKHRGITMFLLDMKSPGVSVRPLINMGDEHGFNEVYFEDVRVPKANVVGELNRGWYHLAVALDFERSSIAGFSGSRRTVEEDLALAKRDAGHLDRNPSVRREFADRMIEIEVGTALAYRIVHLQTKGIIANYEASAAKLFSSELSQRIALTGTHLLGMYSLLRPEDDHAPLEGSVGQSYLSAVSSTIGGGTSEVQRNIIATRGLGLPRG
ncbi:MAG: acyl-CoA dehydrogenase family protein [Chloroflexi bacterium]|nr:acyl-CoA dehydrogenase family protein [Chloroflexota bacterium]MDA1004066.1 acyl-CoA dehydrogenase family protein [Chloroflexota bacterium]